LKSLNKNLAIIITVVVSATIYLGTLFNGFVLDDLYQVLDNPWVTDPGRIPDILTSTVWDFRESFEATDYYRPVMYLTYLAEYHIFGFDAWGWHLVNIILHSLNAILVFLIAASFMNASPLKRGGEVKYASGLSPYLFPLLSALIFAVHPVNSEVVCWVAGGTELTYTLFFLLSFYLFTLAVRNGEERGEPGGFQLRSTAYILSLFSFLVAGFSKEAALVLPFFIILYDYLRRSLGVTRGRMNLKAYPAYFAILIFYLFMRFNAIGEVVAKKLYSDDIFAVSANILPIAVEYLRLLFFPLKLSHYHFFTPASSLGEPMIVFSVVVLAITLFAVLNFVRRVPFASFLVLLIIVPMVPTLYLLFFHDAFNPLAFYSERYLYLPSVGFSILVSFVLMRVASTGENRKKVNALCFVLIVVLAFGALRTFSRSLEWKDNLTLWTSTIERFPENYHARYHISDVLRDRGDKERALKELKESIRLEPDFHGSHHRLGLLYASEGQTDKAFAEFSEVVRVDPNNTSAHQNLGIIYMDRGSWDKAIGELREALRYAPTNGRKVVIKNALAVSFARIGRVSEARRELSEALRLAPEDTETLENIKRLDLLRSEPRR
jgi:Flp pilus assembly protein TadD